jgi:SAM-dependent methyltransferase
MTVESLPGAPPQAAQTSAGVSSMEREVTARFQGIWSGGYREADPLDPLTGSTLYHFGYISVMHAVYLHCIRPYIHPDTAVLEIGCGGGAWTRGMLGAKEIWCLDAKSAQDNQILEHLGHPQNLRYNQVSGADCSSLPDDHFDLVFSYGCLCHLPFAMVRDYVHALYPKVKPGGQAFLMVADYDKFNETWRQREKHSIIHRLPRTKLGGRRYWPVRALLSCASSLLKLIDNVWPPVWALQDKNEDDQPRPARWYHAGVERTCREIEAAGFQVVSRDLNLMPRDPIIHFRKPA